MYKCSECGNLLTEFDVAFQRNMPPKGDDGYCRCFACRTAGHVGDVVERYAACKKKCKEGLRWLLGLWPMLIFLFLYLSEDKINALTLNGSLYDAFLGISAIFGAIYGIIHVIRGWAIGAEFWETILPDQAKEEYWREYAGSHYETTFNSDGTAVTKEVDDYREGGGEGCFWWSLRGILILYSHVSMPIASLCILLFNPIIFRSRVPREFVRAYNKTCKQVPCATSKEMKRLKKAVRTNELKLGFYNERCSAIRSKYSILGNDAVQMRIDRLGKVADETVKIQGRTYFVSDSKFYKKMEKFNLYSMRYGEEVPRTLLANGYFLYEDEPD